MSTPRMLPGSFDANAIVPAAPLAVYVLSSSEDPPAGRVQRDGPASPWDMA